jgi:hypothetical protein
VREEKYHFQKGEGLNIFLDQNKDPLKNKEREHSGIYPTVENYLFLEACHEIIQMTQVINWQK